MFSPVFSAPFGLPGAVASELRSLLVGGYQIPPFLLPIYQAAGRLYGVPWEVLAAINEVETDYGRNMSVSSAGAIGWMQFMPASWLRYAVDATGRGLADPYNPVDAIFAAARYLSAAGASRSLAGAILAYNHAGWYVNSVLLRAKLIGAYPPAMIQALTGLMSARFPVAGRVYGYEHPPAPPSTGSSMDLAAVVLAQPAAPAVAVADARVVSLGASRSSGRFIVLEDADGNHYTYSQLGSLVRRYPVPDLALGASAPRTPPPARAPRVPIGAYFAHAVSWLLHELLGLRLPPGRRFDSRVHSSAPASADAARHLPTQRAASDLPTPPVGRARSAAPVVVTERLFAFPWRPASFAAGGMQQMRQVPTEPIDPIPFTSNVSSGRALARLGPGAIVPAGTILGHLERALPGGQARLGFAITPSGKGARAIDPIPIIDSWRLAAQAGELSAAATSPLMIAENRNPSAGYVLMLSDAALRRRLLADRAIGLTGCGRFEIQAGLVPRRILVAIAYLAAQRLAPEITGIKCALPPKAPTPASISIAGLNGKPVAGNERQGSRGDRAIRALLAMPADLQPSRIITAISYPNQPQVLSLPDHRTAIELDYSAQTPYSTLNAGAWGQLEARLSLLSDPAVSASPSLSSVRVQSPRALLKAENSLLTQ